jgi:hypothetical protein
MTMAPGRTRYLCGAAVIAMVLFIGTTRLHQASSPDEEALVKAAASFNVTMLGRDGPLYAPVFFVFHLPHAGTLVLLDALQRHHFRAGRH